MRRELFPMFGSYHEKSQIVDVSMDAQYIHEIVQSLPLNFMSDGSLNQGYPVLDSEVLIVALRNIRTSEETVRLIFEMYCLGINNFKNTANANKYLQSFKRVINSLPPQMALELSEQFIKHLQYCGSPKDLLWIQGVIAEFVNVFPSTASKFIPQWLMCPDLRNFQEENQDLEKVLFPELRKVDPEVIQDTFKAYLGYTSELEILDVMIEQISFVFLNQEGAYEEKSYVVALCGNIHLNSTHWEKVLGFVSILEGFYRQEAVNRLWNNPSLSLEVRKEYLKRLNFY